MNNLTARLCYLFLVWPAVWVLDVMTTLLGVTKYREARKESISIWRNSWSKIGKQNIEP